MRPLSRRQLLFSAAAAASAQSKPAPPNVLIIVSDDHGYGDVSCYAHGPDVNTPNIDRISKLGVRFTQGYANAYVCAPTRAAIMTGRYPQRFGFFTASDSRAGLPLSQPTLALLLRNHGYRTAAIGKWHLGLDKPYHPLERGFDEFYGFLGHGGHDYFDLKPDPESLHNAIYRNRQIVADDGYLTDNLGREAVNFLRRSSPKPFFLYLAFNAVHFPLQAPPSTIAKYRTTDPKRATYLAMLEHEDKAIGLVLDTLQQSGQLNNTLIFFLSDNGGARNNASQNGPLRDYKHSVYEGGLRVPFLIAWPAGLPAGATCHEPAISHDILATVAAATGFPLPATDGVNLLPYITSKPAQPAHDFLFWDGDEERRAVRHRDWKLIDNKGALELYNLATDLGEKQNLAAAQPAIVTRLHDSLQTWRKANAKRIRPGRGGEE